jgi:hypothetical protein
MDYTTCAPRGAQLLDGRNPQWPFRIRLDTLDMSDPENCIIGQLYDGMSYDHGLETLLGIDPAQARTYGFDLPHELRNGQEIVDGYKRLNSEWTELIRTRREAMARTVITLTGPDDKRLARQAFRSLAADLRDHVKRKAFAGDSCKDYCKRMRADAARLERLAEELG